MEITTVCFENYTFLMVGYEMDAQKIAGNGFALKKKDQFLVWFWWKGIVAKRE